MAIAVYFHPKSMTAAQFDEIRNRLDATGSGHPAGRLHHSCFGTDGDLMVYDIWESPESFEAFGATLMPILQEVGVDAGQPDIMPIYRMDN